MTRPTENTADGFGDPIERQIASTSVKACKGIIYPQIAVGALGASHAAAASIDVLQAKEQVLAVPAQEKGSLEVQCVALE